MHILGPESELGRFAKLFGTLAALSAVALSGAGAGFAQVPVGVLRTESKAKTEAPPVTLPSTIPSGVPHCQDMRFDNTYRPGFLKELTIESFGYDLSPMAQGFERSGLSAGPFTEHGLECPYCVQGPLMNRSRFTLEPFSSQATLHTSDKRVETFMGVGGVEAWFPDNILIPNRRASTFNDAWLTQTQIGNNVAVGRGRHFWLGTSGRYLNNFGVDGRKHWNTLGGSATFRFGRDSN